MAPVSRYVTIPMVALAMLTGALLLTEGGRWFLAYVFPVVAPALVWATLPRVPMPES